jgi:hypothetical protein
MQMVSRGVLENSLAPLSRVDDDAGTAQPRQQRSPPDTKSRTLMPWPRVASRMNRSMRVSRGGVQTPLVAELHCRKPLIRPNSMRPWLHHSRRHNPGIRYLTTAPLPPLRCLGPHPTGQRLPALRIRPQRRPPEMPVQVKQDLERIARAVDRAVDGLFLEG